MRNLRVSAALSRAPPAGPSVGIRSRLGLLVLATALPLIAFAAALVLWHSNTEKQLLDQHASRTAVAAMQAIDRELAGAITGLQVLAASPYLASGEFGAFHAQARSTLSLAGDSVIILYDRDGNRLLSTAVAYGKALPRRIDMSMLSEPFTTGKPYVTPLFVSQTSNHPTVGIVVPVIVGGEVRYVLGAGLLSSRLSDLIVRSGIHSDWVAALLDQEGTIIARTRNRDQFIGTKALPDVWQRIQRITAATGSVEGLTKESAPASLSFARSGSSGWNTVVAIPSDALQGQLHTSLSLVAAAGGAVLLLATLLAWWALRHVTTPIRRLEDIAHALEKGEEIAPRSTGIAQFDQLATVMQDAGRAIREREASLSDSVAQLSAAHEQLTAEHAEKDRFLATLAHELRNPLAPIRTGVQVLARRPAEEVTNRTLAVMERQLSHMVRLIDDLLDVSRITAGKLVLRQEDVDLQKVVSDAIEGADPHIRQHEHRLVVELPDHPLRAHVDPARITQVVTNLLHNATKFSPPGTLISVEVSAHAGMARISVSDAGIGIRPEELDRIFDLFFQVRDANCAAPAGLGIGLSLSKRIVELHGGEISAHSPGMGDGTTFTVQLPCIHEAPQAGVVSLRASAGSKARRIMVVDDNRDAAETLAMALRLEGHSVQVAHDGPAALSLAANGEFEFVLLDIGMAGMDGYEVCRRLRQIESHRRTTIVALTGWGAASDREASQRAGFDAHLTKPADWGEISQLLELAHMRSAGGR